VVAAVTTVAAAVAAVAHDQPLRLCWPRAAFGCRHALSGTSRTYAAHLNAAHCLPPSLYRLLLSLSLTRRDKILCIELRGELFFGSAAHVLLDVRQQLGLAPKAGDAEGVRQRRKRSLWHARPVTHLGVLDRSRER
jgi:hypothetical protein